MAHRGSWSLSIFGVALLAFSIAFSAQAAVLWDDGAHEIGTNGYLRAGGGVSGGETQLCFKAPNAGAKYRLGNECETYIRPGLYYQHRLREGQGAPYVRAEVMPEFNQAYSDTMEYKAMAQAYVEVGNLAGTPAKVWGGRRYYKRRDVHINDYFYMNLKGDGVGVRDLPLGFGDLALTYLQMRDTPLNDGIAWPDQVTTRNYEIGLYNVRANPGGRLMFDLRRAEIQGASFTGSGGPITIHGARGWAVTGEHRQADFLGGKNTLALQYGLGAGRNAWTAPAESGADLGKLTSADRAVDLEAARTWRLVEQHLYDGSRWAMQSAFIWEKREHARFDGADRSWISLGTRPMWYLDDHWRLVGEAGYDRVINHSAANSGHLWKFTAALEWAPLLGFLSRPAVRAYVTQASWSDSLRGQVGAPLFSVDTRGWNAGLQVETWW